MHIGMLKVVRTQLNLALAYRRKQHMSQYQKELQSHLVERHQIKDAGKWGVAVLGKHVGGRMLLCCGRWMDNIGGARS